jgi:hypothetical protein
MGKTRRALYGKQRGGFNPLKAAVLAAVAALASTPAQGFVSWRELTSGRMPPERIKEVSGKVVGWLAEHRPVGLAERTLQKVDTVLTELNTELSTAMPGPSILGEMFTITGTLPSDIKFGDTVRVESSFTDEDDDGNPVVMYSVKRQSDINDAATSERTYDVRADQVTLTPVKRGGRAIRKQQRKTLRRKK